MSKIHYGVCNICDSICGLEIEYEGSEVISIRGDKQDPFSRGHICPKGPSHKDVYKDPDRLRKPVRRNGDKWEEISWEQGLDEAGKKLAAVQKKYGNDAVAVYYGNPTTHNMDSASMLLPWLKGFKSKNIFSVNSVDALTRMFVSLLVFGNQAILPVPDIERTEHFLIIGANPVVSKGSVMTAPDCKKRLLEIKERGGKIIVIDPRRNETAEIADKHYFIRPGTDALFLFAMLDVIFKHGLSDLGKLAGMVEGLEKLKSMAAEFPPERVSGKVGISAGDIRAITKEFCSSKKAVCYGRMGISCQEFGSLATWLIDVVNVVTGNLDRPGGAMFTTPAVDLVGLSKLIRLPGTFNKWQSRVSGLPEFNGELPVAALAEEIETEGPGQVKALVVMAGNLVLSCPNGNRFDRAFQKLDYMVSIDFYINETSRNANIIFPPTMLLEAEHYGILEHTMGIRNTAHYAPALFPKPEGAKHNSEIMLDLLYHVEKHRGPFSHALGWVKRKGLDIFSARVQLDLLLRFGPHKLSIKKLMEHPHGMDLGPLAPRIEELMDKPKRKIILAPEILVRDLGRLKYKLEANDDLKKGEYLLISRRSINSMNSWMHNLPSLARGRSKCTLMMCPKDAGDSGLKSGQEVVVSSRTGAIRAPLEVTDEMMPGVVCLATGWGHDRNGARLSVASLNPGVSMNDITDDALLDKPSGIAVFHGIPVKVSS